MVSSVRAFAEPRLSPDGTRISWLHSHAGRGDLVVRDLHPAGPECFVTTDPTISSKVGHGGGLSAWEADSRGLLFRSGAGDLWAVAAGGGVPREVLSGVDARAPSCRGSYAACMATVSGHDMIVAFDPLGGLLPARVSRTGDFCFDPDMSADGGVAWLEWDGDRMPWDGSRIMVGSAGSDPVELDGAHDVSVMEPRFSPDGRLLAYISDRGGSWDLWIADVSTGDTRPLPGPPGEIGGPAWGPGARSFAWAPDGSSIVHTVNKDACTDLWVTDVQEGTSQPLAVRGGTFAWVTWEGESIAAAWSNPTTAQRIEVIDPATGDSHVVSPRGSVDFGDWGRTEHISWQGADGEEVFGLWSVPSDAGGLLPTIVWIHGGPTGQARLQFNPRLAFFVSRGYAVLQVNHRGSTGYGRRYMRALDGRWGELDVLDVLSGVEALTGRGIADPSRLAIMGGSAGGYTVLQTLIAAPDVFAAGIDLFGVSDLFRLAETTHRFEAAYNDRLVGPLPEAADLYAERSPVRHAGRIRTPLLVLQGAKDEVVPPEQSEEVVRAVERNGVAVEYRCYEGEGHGWSRPETVADELARIEAFLRRHVLRVAR